MDMEPTQARNDAAIVATALSDPTRLRILGLLQVRGPLCLSDIMEALNLKQPIASHHTAVLTRAGMLANEKDGRYSMYRVGAITLNMALTTIRAAVVASRPEPAEALA